MMNRASTPDNQRPRRTERAHRGKPDFYSPSDYENPFKKQRRRTASAESDIPKKKGRPPKINLGKIQKFEETQEVEKNDEMPPEEPLDQAEDNVENDEDEQKQTTPVTEMQRPHLALNSMRDVLVKSCSIESNSPKEQKDQPKSKDSKEKDSKEKPDIYSTLNVEKSLQCAIILAELSRKFQSQNFKPA